MNKITSTLLVLLFSASLLAQKQELFNGESLEGWSVYGTEKWYVEDGLLICESGPDAEYGYLGTDKHYKNFILDLDFKQTVDGTTVSGWQVEVAPPGAFTGGIYESYGRQWLIKPTLDKDKALKFGEWNHMKIKVDGKVVTSWVNGVEMVSLKDRLIGKGEGAILLQIHSGGGIKVKWKNIQIEELD
jgi:hypothetical protein